MTINATNALDTEMTTIMTRTQASMSMLAMSVHTQKGEPMRLIDADALINELNNSHYPGAPYVDAGISIAIGKVCDAPTIEPERKKGKWIDTGSGQECSECGEIQYGYDNGRHFCANCGADMRGGQDEQENNISG